MQGGRFGEYEIVDRLSSGGMGVVWRARRPDAAGLTAEVAIKTVQVVDEASLRGIRAEIRALGRVRHPGVVRILAEGVRDGLPWYAMELLRGTTLRCFVRELHPRAAPEESTMDTSPVDEPEPPTIDGPPVPAASGELARVIGVFRALAEVLAWLHGEGIVHRDLKPENVFVGPDGPVLVDFGLAHEVVGAGTSRESLDALALAGGTVTYMAPEQALGDLVDARADLYALGVMLYEAICGRPPFVGTRSAVVFAKIGQRAPSIDGFAQGVPAPLSRLLEELLHPDPRSRTAHALLVADVLARLGAPEPAFRAEPRPYVYRPVFQPPGTVIRTVADRVQAGGALVHLLGDAGSGRTRVLVEVAQSLRQAGFLLVSCPCVPAAGASVAAPLDPLRPVLRLVLDRALAAPRGPAEEALAAHGSLLARFEPALREHPVVARADELPQLRPDTERVRLFEALRAFVEVLGARERALLVMDDLHYADELTVAFLASLRPEDLARVGVLSAGSEPWPAGIAVELPPLDEDQVRAMVASMCGGTDAPPSLVSVIAQRSGGKPFVVAELLRAAIVAGAFGRDRAGVWVLRSSALEALELPTSVTALVDHRLAAVSPADQAALCWAAVLGFGAEEELLLRRADPASVDRLVAASILGFDERGRLRFPSPTLAEVVHGRIPPDERRSLHAEAARALLPARPGRHGRIARHLREAADPRAFDASLLAGEEALAGIAFDRAVAELQAARERLPAEVAPAVRTRLELRLGRAHWGSGDATRCLECLGTALEVAGEAPGRGVIGAFSVGGLLIGELWRLARPDRSPEPPVEVAEHHADLAEVHRYLVYLEILRNEPVRMLASALRASAHGSAGGRRARRAADVATLGVVAGFAGLRGLARRWFDRAEARLRSSRDHHDEVLVSLAVASLALGDGRWADLHRAIERGEVAARVVGDAEQASVLGQMRCTALLLEGRAPEAVERCDEVILRSRSQMPRLWSRCVLVDALLSTGALDRASAEVRTVLAELGPEGGDHATRCNVLALQAALWMDHGQIPEARETVALASELCRRGSEEAFGVFPYHCHVPATWLRLLEADPSDPVVREEAERAVKGAARYASRFAIGRAPALRHEGVLHALRGDGARATAALRSARAAAESLNMREQGLLAEAEELRVSPDAGRATALRTSARRLGLAGTLRRTGARG